ncbi:snRNA-activating protein complex subunit 2 [Pristis pectinata]|uniref:snRNA-activating protein complex subunit 2 n=1 Tax=Pristis pectinata TaxID=685728 RepID=UPI00223E1618|nr:snRNA-activating protein complex subunit 2 [Pristis pectinata]
MAEGKPRFLKEEDTSDVFDRLPQCPASCRSHTDPHQGRPPPSCRHRRRDPRHRPARRRARTAGGGASERRRSGPPCFILAPPSTSGATSGWVAGGREAPRVAMKPPVRARAAPQRYGVEGDHPGEEVPCGIEEWSSRERRLVLRALRRQSTARELDLLPIELAVPSRSPQEVAAYIRRLRERATRSAIQKANNRRLQERRRRQQQLRAPLQIWSELAEAVTGTLDEVISTAVSQTLMIAATEPVCRQHSVKLTPPCGEKPTAESARDQAGGPHLQHPPREEAAGSEQSDGSADPDNPSLEVDFARIYRLLSAAMRGAALPQLAPLECAVLLDLLLSLPGQLKQLSHRELGAHLDQAYSRLHRTTRCRQDPPQGQAPTPGVPAAAPDPPRWAESGPGPPVAPETGLLGTQEAEAWPLNPFGIPLELLIPASALDSLHPSLDPTSPCP